MLDATPLLKAYAWHRRRVLSRQDSVRAQIRQLLRLVKRAAGTKFGRDHNFDGIRTVADFQLRVPLRRYEEFWTDYWQDIFPHIRGATWPGPTPYFALTSGTTTDTTKYIPCTPEMVRANRRAGLDILVHHVTNRTDSHVFAGKTLMLGGSTDFRPLAPGVAAGDLSGIATTELPWWIRHRSLPPNDIALLSDWEDKIDRIADLCTTEPIRAISGTPSWLLIFFDRLAGQVGAPVSDARGLFPDLELIVYGGVQFGPYRDRFERFISGSHAELREVYPASEGFFAVADRDIGAGMRLIADNGIFYEFIPVDELAAAAPTRHWLGTVEPGIDYALACTTCAGLWSYLVGDTVRFVDRRPPRLLVTGRTSFMLSAFGEHLIVEEIDRAISDTAAALDLTVAEYAVGPVYPDDADPVGGHLFVIEFVRPPVSNDWHGAFSQGLDQRLAEYNEDYAAHRADGFGLRPPEILHAPSGCFAAWMQSRGKLGGQHKVPRVINDPSLFDGLRGFVTGIVESSPGVG